jgi:hypothetical protein
MGVALLDTQVDSEYLRTHYEIEDFVLFSEHQPDEHILLERMLLSPQFENKRRYFLKVLYLCCECKWVIIRKSSGYSKRLVCITTRVSQEENTLGWHQN